MSQLDSKFFVNLGTKTRLKTYSRVNMHNFFGGDRGLLAIVDFSVTLTVLLWVIPCQVDQFQDTSHFTISDFDEILIVASTTFQTRFCKVSATDNQWLVYNHHL